MNELIQTYNDHIKELNEKYRQALNDRADNAGSANYGVFNIVLRDLEKMLTEATNKRDTLLKTKAKRETPGYDPNEDKIYIFVISGSLDRVKATLGKKFNLLGQKLLHNFTSDEWIPFSDENVSITAFLQDFKKLGFDFNVIYLEGKADGSILKKIVDQNRNNIAIVDLMALDLENRTTAIYFDGRNNNTVFTPICQLLNNKLKKFLSDLRKEVFVVVESDYMSMPSFMFDVSTKRHMEREILNYLKRHDPGAPVLLANRPGTLAIGRTPFI